MSAKNGTLYAIFATVGTVVTASASTDRMYACRDSSIKFTVDTPDATTKESAAWWEGITGIRDVTIDFSGVWDDAGSATTLTATEIAALIIAGNAAMKFAFVPAALGTTIPGWMGMGFFNGLSITAPYEKPCEFSGSVKGTGAWAVFTA